MQFLDIASHVLMSFLPSFEAKLYHPESIMSGREIRAASYLDASLSIEIAVASVIAGYISDVHPAWFIATAYHESSFNPNAIGDNGRAFGLCQIHLPAAKSAVSLSNKNNMLSPSYNIIVAGLHYRNLIKKYGRTIAQVRYACGFRCNKVTKSSKVKMTTFKRILKTSGG